MPNRLNRLLSIGFLIAGFLVWAGGNPNGALAQSRSNTDPDKAQLERIAQQFKLAVTSSPQVWARAGKGVRLSDSSGVESQILGLVQNRPLAYTTHNRRAAASVGVNSLWEGGRSGLVLHGQGQLSAVWDAGNVRVTHRELVGRATQKDTTVVGASHATHVAGTMAGSGVWDITRGMAPAAMVDSYDWVDDVAEMAEAAANGLTLSNHSYGIPMGWTPNFHGDGVWTWMGDLSVSRTTDYRFGFYDFLAEKWDQISHAAPGYLIIKSAGNERDQVGPKNGQPHYVYENGWEIQTEIRDADAGPTGFDTIGDAGVAKNVLTVGASETAPWRISAPSDVKMTSFSGWGPTDDGRIKPDLVAPGVQLMSAKAASDEDYGPSSGTSMAAPVVTGAATLLQELYQREFPGATPLSSTIKGLLIHTADEAGPADGPDYQFGWGQINAEKAALHLRQAGISSRSQAPTPPFEADMLEAELAPGEVMEWTVSIDEERPFRATLVWIDPAAESGEKRLNDPTVKLVHDLNLEVFGDDGQHLPWVLNPASPTTAAARGVNAVDNVEQVAFWASPGLYTVRVTAPAILVTPTQSFSLLLGEAEEHFEATALSTLTGEVTMEGAGIQDVRVHVQGPVWVNFNTPKDGVFFFQDLPAGTYEVFPENDWLTFSPASLTITLPNDANRIHFEAISPLTLNYVDIFESPRLLHQGEVESGRTVTTLAAGGVYAVTLGFVSPMAHRVNGLKVLLDDDFDENVYPFTGATGIHFREMSDDWLLSAYDATHLTKRIPAFWIDGNTPIGSSVRLPYSVRLSTDQIIFADTLEFLVDRPDDQAPIPHPTFRLPGLAYAPPGSPMEVRVSTIDGSPTKEVTALFLDRDNESVILHSIPMRDNGDIENDLDLVANDRLFSAQFVPRIEADYRLAIRTVDIHNNEYTLISDAYYSSKPFNSDPNILFWTTYETGSATKLHQSVFDEIGFPYAWWDELTRGQLKASDLANFDLVVLSRHKAPIRTEADRKLIADFVRGGGKMVILAETPVENASRDWLSTEFGWTFSDSSENTGVVEGMNELQGFSGTLAPGSKPSIFGYSPESTPILSRAGQPVAVKSKNLILSSVTAASLVSQTDRVNLISRLLYAASALTSTLTPLVTPIFDQSSGTKMTKDQPYLTWTNQPFATYQLQLSLSSDFDPFWTISLAESSFDVTSLSRGQSLYARVKAVNPVSQTDWSEPISFETPPKNRAPIAVETGYTLFFPETSSVPKVIPGVSSFFLDPDGDELILQFASSNSRTVEVSINNDQLIIRPVGVGETTVSVTATDLDGLSARVDFLVRVRVFAPDHQSPVYVGTFPTETFLVVGEQIVRDFSTAFTDANLDPIELVFIPSSPNLFQHDFTNGVLTLSPTAVGTSLYYIKALDGNGGEALFQEVIHVAVNQPPILEFEPITQTFLSGMNWELDLSSLFQDPEGKTLTFTGQGTPSDAFTLRNDSLFAVFGSPGAYTYTLNATDVHDATTSVLLQFSISNQAAVFSVSDEIPASFSISSVFPHPFSDRTSFSVHVPDPGPFKLAIHDLQGRLVATVADSPMDAGIFHVAWAAPDLPAGAYIYVASWLSQRQTGVIIKTK